MKTKASLRNGDQEKNEGTSKRKGSAEVRGTSYCINLERKLGGSATSRRIGQPAPERPELGEKIVNLQKNSTTYFPPVPEKQGVPGWEQ